MIYIYIYKLSFYILSGKAQEFAVRGYYSWLYMLESGWQHWVSMNCLDAVWFGCAGYRRDYIILASM